MKVAMADQQDLSTLSSNARLQGHQVCKRGRKYIVECKSAYVAFAPKIMAIPRSGGCTPSWCTVRCLRGRTS